MMAAVAVCASAYAQEAEKKDSLPTEAAMLQAAGQLVEYGYANEEALPLVQAAQIYKTYLGGQLDATKTTEGGADDQAAKASKVSHNVDQLLAAATTFADGNQGLLAVINDVKNSASRGATSYFPTRTERVKAHATDVYNVRFEGGEPAVVIVDGDGDTDLDLYVYDNNGNLVASDTDYTDYCICTWTPRWTGNFKIKIVNRGDVYNEYLIGIN